MNLGLALMYQGKDDEAYDVFFKATWTAAEQETGYYYIAAIDCRRGDCALALEHIMAHRFHPWEGGCTTTTSPPT